MFHIQEDYLFRILSLAGYNLTEGTDLRLFALTASLCKKIVNVDGWMGKMIENQDFDQLEQDWHKVGPKRAGSYSFVYMPDQVF